MNETIKKILSNAKDYTMCNDPALLHHAISGVFVEKFAELIIRECAEFANEHNEEVEGVTLGVGQALKKHFGVAS